jgi:hypothetical protein
MRRGFAREDIELLRDEQIAGALMPLPDELRMLQAER